MQSRLAVILVNYKTPGLTVDCLKSLAPEVASNPGTRVVVVDNGSGDDSASRIRAAIEAEGWGSWCTLIASEKNWGFAGGNNRGQERVDAEGGAKFILLLNSDTLVRPGCLAHCLAVMESDPSIGVMSCRLVNADGTFQNNCRRFPSPARCFVAAMSLPWKLPRLFGWADCEDLGWDRNTVSRDVEWLGGAFLLFRGDWIARFKGLDERFFFYGEDIEICHRVWRTGFRCHYDPRAVTVHLGGSSSDPSRMSAGSRSIHSWRGRYLVQRICYGMVADYSLRIIDLVNVGIRVLWGRVTGRGKTEGFRVMADEFRILRRNWRRWSEHAT